MLLRRRQMLPCWTLCWILTASGMAHDAAADSHHSPVVFGRDDRHIVDTAMSPWNAIGRVNTTVVAYEFRFCTGFLVAPDTVLTLAQCVAPLKNQPGRLHFVTGDLRGEYQEHSIVKCVQISDDPTADPRTQVARLKLRKALQAAPLAIIPAKEIAVGDAVSHAGYGGDRPFVLSADETCHVTGMKGNSLMTDCDTAPGQAGGPILHSDKKRWRVAAMMADAREGRGSGGPLASVWQYGLDDLDCD